MISFGSIPQRSGGWTWFWQLCAQKLSSMQYDEESDTYLIYAYDGPEVFFCTIWKGTVPESVTPNYSQAQNDADKAAFEAAYKAKANASLEPKDSRGYHSVVFSKSGATKATIITHDWCDKTTWFTDSVRVVDEVPPTILTPLLVYQLAHADVIDIYHGKLVQEDYLVDGANNSYRAVVKVNGVAQVEHDPHTGNGGCYSVNYTTGVITFDVSLPIGAVVTVTYHYATTSVFHVRPLAGKMLTIDIVEVQFAADVMMNDTVVFQVYGFVDVFAPFLMPGVPSGTKIPLGNPLKYKSFRDFLADAVKSYPAYAALGLGNWRGLSQPVYVFNWDYVTSTVLKSSLGLEIRISLERNIPFGGSLGTASLYCFSSEEV